MGPTMTNGKLISKDKNSLFFYLTYDFGQRSVLVTFPTWRNEKKDVRAICFRIVEKDEEGQKALAPQYRNNPQYYKTLNTIYCNQDMTLSVQNGDETTNKQLEEVLNPYLIAIKDNLATHLAEQKIEKYKKTYIDRESYEAEGEMRRMGVYGK